MWAKIYDSKGLRQNIHFPGFSSPKNCSSRSPPDCVPVLFLREPRLVRLSVENHRFAVAVEQDAVVDVPADGPGKDDFFKVAALLDEVFDRIAVRDAHDVLL